MILQETVLRSCGAADRDPGARRRRPAAAPGGGGGAYRLAIRILASLLLNAGSALRVLMGRVDELEEKNTGLNMRVHELAAGKKAVEKQARELRGALVDTAGELDKSRAEHDRKVREMDGVIRAKDKDIDALKDDNSGLQCELATTKAVLELEAARARPSAGAAAAGDLMSRPGLAVSTSLPAQRQAQEPPPPPQQQQQQRTAVLRVGGGGGGGGGGDSGGDALAAENASLKRENASLKRENASLKRENAVASNPNTPSRELSVANMMRRKFRAVAGLAYRKDADKAGRKRGGQPGHKGCSNNDPVAGRFMLPRPKHCPDCKVELEQGNSATSRYWMREGKFILGLTAVDEKGAEILRTSSMPAEHDAVGRRFCGSISFKRGKCPCCGGVFEMAHVAVIRGSATCKDDRDEIVSYCIRVPDGELAKQMRARTSFPLKAGAVRNARGAARDTVMPHNAKVPGRIGKEDFHSNDESTIKGKSGGGG